MGRTKRYIKSWVFGAIPAFIGFNALACQPCVESLSLPDTIQKAEVIIIGERKTGKNKAYARGPIGENDYITLSVSKVLKGTNVPALIKVRAWYGMCPYGIDLDKKQTAIIYLRKVNSHYESVDTGCSEQFTLIRDHKVMVNGEALSLADFLKLYSL